MALNPVRTPPAAAYSPVAPEDDAMDLDKKIEKTSKRTLEQMREGSPESEEGRLRKRARIQAADELFAEWASPKANALIAIEPELQQTPNPFTLIKIRLKVPEGQIPPTFEIPRFALIALSPEFKKVFSHGTIESASASMTWALADPFPYIHPQAANYVVRFAQQKVKFISAGATLAELKGKFPGEFDAIFRDIVRLSFLYEIGDVRAECIQFLKEELKTDIEAKFPHYFHWTFTTPEPLLKFFREALVELSQEPEWRAKIWPLLLALYEGDYHECSTEQKGECQEYLQDCFEKLIETKFDLDWNQELNDFCQCFVGLFPRFDFQISLLKKMRMINPFSIENLEILNPLQWPSVFYVVTFIKVYNGGIGGEIPMDIPAEGKLREYQLLLQARKREQRFEKLNEVIANFPENLFAIYARTEILIKERNDAAAHEDLERLLQLKPDHRDGLNSKGFLHAAADELDAAINVYEKILKHRNDDIPALTKIGQFYVKQGLFVEAMRSFNRALDLDPQSPDAFCERARCYYWQGNLDAAWEDTEQALRLNKTSILARKMQADLHLKRGKFKEAIGIYNQVLSGGPDHFMLEKRGECHLRMGNLEEANRDINICLRTMRRNYATVHALRGLWHLKKGDIASARWDLASALEDAAQIKAKLDQHKALSLCVELKEQLDQISR